MGRSRLSLIVKGEGSFQRSRADLGARSHCEALFPWPRQRLRSRGAEGEGESPPSPLSASKVRFSRWALAHRGECDRRSMEPLPAESSTADGPCYSTRTHFPKIELAEIQPLTFPRLFPIW